MTDIVSAAVRSRMMSAIRSRDTAPEMQVRRALHQRGFRYLLHARKMPGRPDLVFPKWRAVIFVHGCFWHGHDCNFFRLPATRTEWWRDKINGNVARDARAVAALRDAGWRVAVVWECALGGKQGAGIDRCAEGLARFLRDREKLGVFST